MNLNFIWLFFSNPARLIVNTSLPIAFSGTCLVLSSYAISEKAPSLTYVLLVFSLIWFTYSFNKLTDWKEDSINNTNLSKTGIIKKYGKLIVFISFLLLLWSSYQTILLTKEILLLVAVWIIAGFSYSVLRLKKIFILKNLLIGLTWASITLVPAIGSHTLITGSDFVLFANVSLLFFVNTVIFDVKDIKGDRLCNINTIPVKLGERNTRLLCIGLLSFITVVDLFLYASEVITSNYLMFFFVVIIYQAVYCLIRNKSNNAIYYGLIVDGEWVVGYLFLLFI